jgi:predicted nucleic acid-binding protein
LDVIPDDPQDNYVIECAVVAGASYIITGDDHLLTLGEYHGIQILPPASFVVFLNLWDTFPTFPTF